MSGGKIFSTSLEYMHFNPFFLKYWDLPANSSNTLSGLIFCFGVFMTFLLLSKKCCQLFSKWIFENTSDKFFTFKKTKTW